MSYPDVSVEFSPTTDPLETPAWEDISAYLRSFSYERGRAKSVNRAEAGTATIVLDNMGGRFDPDNVDGPYYPGVRPMRRIRIRAVVDTGFDSFTVGSSFVGGPDVLGSGLDAIPMFYGFVEGWTQNWNPAPAPHADATATITAVDAFKVFSLHPLLEDPGGTGPFYSGFLIEALLDGMDWPVGDRRIEHGQMAVIPPTPTAETRMLELFRAIDESEGGLFFMGPDGAVVFTDSEHIYKDPPPSSEIWGDTFSERDYGTITIAYDESVLVNSALLTGSGVGPVRADDPLSKERYMLRELSRDTLNSDLTALQTRAFDFVARFSEPRREITELEVGRRDDIDWRHLLRHDIQDRVLVRRRPEGEPIIEQDSIIEGIAVDSPSKAHTNVRWRLSAAYGVNKLHQDQSSLENGSTSGWSVLSNCTIGVNTPPFGGANVHGTHHLEITPIVSGDVSVETAFNTQASMAVIVGETYTAGAYWNPPGGGAFDPTGARVDIAWRDSGGSLLSVTTGALSISTGFSTVYDQAIAQGVAPVNAAFATVRVTIVGVPVAAVGNVYDVDAVGFSHGVGAAWSIGRGDLV